MTISNKYNDYLSLKEMWEFFIGNIKWFVLSVTICLFVAISYIVFTPPTYTHEASVLVGSRSKQENGQIGSNALNDVGISLLNTNSNAASELHVFQSVPLMEEVVRRLKLDYDYSIRFKSLRNVSLYLGSPIIVVLDSSLVDTGIGFNVNIETDSLIRVSNLIINGVDMDFDKEVGLYQDITLPYGSIKILPSSCYKDYMGKTIQFSRNSIKSVAKRYSGGLSAKLSEDKAPIIELQYHDTNHQRADDVLNTLIEVYNENWISDKNQITVSTSAFIDERLNVIENELGSVDNNISTYKSSRLLPDVDAITNVYLSQASTNRTQLISLQNQLSVTQYILSFLQDGKNGGQLLPANAGVDNSNINTQIDRYNVQLLEKNKLAASSSEQNPLVIDMNSSLEMMKNVIVRSVNEYITTINIQIANITKEEQKTNAKLSVNPGEAKYLLSEERKQKVKEGLYLFLLQQREQNELSQTFTAYNTKIVNYPQMGDQPPTPRKSIIMIVALFIGLIIPALILWIKEKTDTLVRDREDLKSLSMPFIGEIPIITARKRFSRLRRLCRLDKKESSEQSDVPTKVVEEKSRNIVNEAFRNIRTNIDFMKPKVNGGVVIMNSSLFPSSGKTFVVTNLSLAMGVKGCKVVVIDTDLRKATLSKLVDSPGIGLSNYLNDEDKQIDQITVRGNLHPSVDIIPVGIIPPNPSELLLSDRFSALIEQLRQKYEYIFLDCPPAEIVTDSSIISKHCDMTLFVVRAGAFDKRLLPEIESLYKSKVYNGSALILNGVEYHNRDKYGRYGYGKYGKYGYHRYGTSYYANK